MKQVLQDIRSGQVSVHEVPEPAPADGWVLVAVERSLISSGTERAVASLGAKSIVQKAKARPDLVRKTLDVARAEGVGVALAKVRSRLDQPMPFGYSLAGRVLDTGGDARLATGDLVACIGAGYASHAEVVSVPRNLVVPVPDGVSADAAAFAAPAAIALHATRLAEVGPGSTVAVVGLGLLGQVAGHLLRAAGLFAVGTDPREDRRRLFGSAAAAEELAEAVGRVSRGRGADAVLVFAAAASSEPISVGAAVARDRAKLVVVGDVPLELDRRTFYEKELDLVVARSYGPGRYDRGYEEGGVDYPPAYVRWTEGRNVEAVLDLLGSGNLDLGDLVTHRFSIDDGARAYETLFDDPSSLGILLEYEAPRERRTTIRQGAVRARAGSVALVGAGGFARGTLLPALQAAGLPIVAVCARTGASSASLAGKVGAGVASTDWREVVALPDVDAVVIATPHREHAAVAAAALQAGKAVWVEKPLAIDADGLRAVARAARRGLLLVGHNRRFAPLALELKRALAGPLAIGIRVAAGPLAPGHWLDDPSEGGQVLGEISHFVDLASFLAGAPPSSVTARSVPAGAAESLVAVLAFPDGSAATITYGVGSANGLAKERVEVLGAEGAAVLDDFHRLELYGSRRSTTKGRRDKGHRAAVAAFAAAVRGERPLPVSVDEQLLVAAASLASIESARSGASVPVEIAG